MNADMDKAEAVKNAALQTADEKAGELNSVATAKVNKVEAVRDKANQKRQADMRNWLRRKILPIKSSMRTYSPNPSFSVCL
jgi:hypothetical protein